MAINRTATPLVDVPRGLAGVVVTETEIGDVRGREGFYHYRQYSAVDLAGTRRFEDVWHLLVHGTLPDAERGAAFAAETAALRRLPEEVRASLPAIAAASRASARWPDCAPGCPCWARRGDSGRCTTWTPTGAAPTRSPPAPPYPRCSPRCTGWGRGLSPWSRGRTCRTPPTTCTC